ncbi:UNVERIFIED_CONTAM: hypothetical protein PYX00_000779 [Menopon gallinae]|uniref:GST C-terminal domain-containing protein n=1 Tax=Menopon gallinae TaxID=328185 RepID=A0AAW2I9Y7_9NEOP
MLEQYLEKIILDFCSYYGRSAEVSSFENGKVPVVQIKGCQEPVKGLRNVVSAVGNVSNKSSEESAVLDQWVEYAVTNAAYLQNSSNLTHILKELNGYLSDKVYFMGSKLTPVDVLLYLFIHDAMVALSFQEKESYLNVSRWFNHIQQDQKIRSGRVPIHFSRTRLYA